MIKKNKTGLTAFFGICPITSMLSACGARTTEPSPDQPYTQPQGQNMQQQAQNIEGQGLERANLPGTTPQPAQGGMLGVNPEDNQGINQGPSPRTNQPSQQMAPDKQKSENIKSQLKNMREVADANVIVIGNTALVGCKPSGNSVDINTTKNMIANKVKEIDKTITNVTVSEQPDIMNKINQLGDDITNNRQINNITNEFNQIIRGINLAAQ